MPAAAPTLLPAPRSPLLSQPPRLAAFYSCCDRTNPLQYPFTASALHGRIDEGQRRQAAPIAVARSLLLPDEPLMRPFRRHPMLHYSRIRQGLLDRSEQLPIIFGFSPSGIITILCCCLYYISFSCPPAHMPYIFSYHAMTQTSRMIKAAIRGAFFQNILGNHVAANSYVAWMYQDRRFSMPRVSLSDRCDSIFHHHLEI